MKNFNHILQQLQAEAGIFTPESLEKKLALLNGMKAHKTSSFKAIVHYHDLLIFLMAYPQNKDLLNAASGEMQRITEEIRASSALMEKGTGTGLAFTRVQSQFSFTLVKWLAEKFPSELSLHSFGKGLHPREAFKHTLSPMEFELSSDEDSDPLKWIRKAFGTSNKKEILKRMISALNELPCADDLREQLFDSMQVFVELRPASFEFSRGQGKLSVPKIYYHTEPLLKKFNEREWINMDLPKRKKLSANEREEILSVSRIALALLHRETDPITYNSKAALEFYELERGLSIALFSIDPDNRLPMESYAGFMMFKNGSPMSYGGAWLFHSRALIGINIFEPFRGGESALVFAQLLRVYHKAYGAEYFEVEPYQFGKHNTEGINSGAFWFYHRFGFRPLDPELFRLAETEHKKITKQKGYRSDSHTLRRFTGSNLFANFGKKPAPIDPAKISRHISRTINERFGADRKKAEQAAVTQLKRSGIAARTQQKLLFFFAFCMDERRLAKRRKVILQLLESKEKDEFEYIRSLAKTNLSDLYSKEFLKNIN